MNLIRIIVHVAEDGAITGCAPEGVPPGGHEAEIVVQPFPRSTPPIDKKVLLARIRAIQEEIARLPVLDSRSADEILGYNESGVFD